MTLSSIRDSLWAPDWLWGVAVLLIAAICALIAHRLIFMAFDRAFRARHPFLLTGNRATCLADRRIKQLPPLDSRCRPSAARMGRKSACGAQIHGECS
jgi:hypothetical protein